MKKINYHPLQILSSSSFTALQIMKKVVFVLEILIPYANDLWNLEYKNIFNLAGKLNSCIRIQKSSFVKCGIYTFLHF